MNRAPIHASRRTIRTLRRAIWVGRRPIPMCRRTIHARRAAIHAPRAAIYISRHATYMSRKAPHEGEKDFLPRNPSFPQLTGMKNILNRGFSQLTVDALVTKVQFIIAQLTGNPAFVVTKPTLAELQAALDGTDAGDGIG